MLLSGTSNSVLPEWTTTGAALAVAFHGTWLRAADIHLFVSSDPNYMANNIHYECFQQANKYAFKNKLVSYQAGKYNQYSQARNPEHVAGQPNTLFKYYPGISMINDDGLPTVPLNDIPSLVQKLYALYLPLRDGPFTPSGVTCQAVDVIDFAIVYSAARCDVFSDIDPFIEALQLLIQGYGRAYSFY